MDNELINIISILNLSLLNDSQVIKRLNKELDIIENIEVFENAIGDIKNLNEISREKGIIALGQYYDNTKSYFLQDLVIITSKVIRTCNSEVYIVSSLMTPQLKNGTFDNGIEFITNLLYYEALLLIVAGMPTWMIEYKISSIITKRIKLKDL